MSAILEHNAAQSAFYAANPMDDAMPTWDDVDREGRTWHREVCANTCAWCADHRLFGTCSSCGAWPREADDDGYGCCGSVILTKGDSFHD